MSRIAWAQTYPTRPVRLIVPLAPGGATDIIARLIGQWLSERLGQQFVIENRPGAGTNIATEAVVRSPADGYTLLLVNAANAINGSLYSKLSYDFLRDIAPVASMIRVALVVVVPPSTPAKTIPEFIAYAKANPGKINMASGGSGGPDHASGELFQMMTGAPMTHVPYRGLAPALSDLIGEQVQVIFATVPAAIEYIKAGKLRARRQRPRGCGTAEQRDELASPHSITSSAATCTVCGTLMPSVLAALRLRTNWTFMDCWTGRSPGLSPFRMRPT